VVGANIANRGGAIRHPRSDLVRRPRRGVHDRDARLCTRANYGFSGTLVLAGGVNFGAGTTTSNLKSTYGPVRLDSAGTKAGK